MTFLGKKDKIIQIGTFIYFKNFDQKKKKNKINKRLKNEKNPFNALKWRATTPFTMRQLFNVAIYPPNLILVMFLLVKIQQKTKLLELPTIRKSSCLILPAP